MGQTCRSYLIKYKYIVMGSYVSIWQFFPNKELMCYNKTSQILFIYNYDLLKHD